MPPRIPRWAPLEESDDEFGGGARSDSSGEDLPVGSEAANMLLDMLLLSQLKGDISAQTLCTTCFWASRAGAAEPIGRYGKPPGLQSGAYQRHLDARLQHKPQTDPARIKVPVPTYLRHRALREVVDTPMMMPHVLLQQEVRQHIGFADVVRDYAANNKLPRAYADHPVVLAAGADEPIAPIGTYIYI